MHLALVIHRTEDKIELIRLSIHPMLLERPGSPGVDAAESLLDEVEIDPGLAGCTIVFTGFGLEFEGMCLIVSKHSDIHFLPTERQNRC